MQKIRSGAICFVVVAAFWIFSTSVQAQPLPGPSEVLNRSYVSSCGREKPATLQLKDGKFGRYLLLADEERKMELIVLGTAEIRVSGDKRRHYAVFAKCDVYGTDGYELFILRRSGRRLEQIASSVSNGVSGLYGVKEIRQSNGSIVIGLDYLESARSKVVGRHEFEFRWAGRKLDLVGHRRIDK